MKKENLIAIAIVGGIILLGIGFCLGLNLGKKAAKEVNVETPLTNLLASRVIRGLTTTASGEVTAISGQNLTLTNEGDTLTISIREDASLYRLLPPNGKATETPQPVAREEIKFADIKIGDKVNIASQLKADASLEGIEATVLP